MTPFLANVDGLVPPAFDTPTKIRLISRVVESIPIKDIEEHVIVEFADSRAWRTASFFCHSKVSWRFAIGRRNTDHCYSVLNYETS